MNSSDARARGISIAISSAVFLGLAPIFGKLAINAGLSGLATVALRTVGAASLLLIAVLIINRSFLYIYPIGFLGCVLAGVFNGIGSLMYYSGLARLDAGLAQLIFSLYPVMVAGLLYLDGQRHSRLTLLRLGLSIPALVLLTAASANEIDSLGVFLMIGAAFMYAIHIPINQRVLFEAPAPTVTLYTLFAMTAVVLPVYFLLAPDVGSIPTGTAIPLMGLTAVTFFSRITLFSGVKTIGGMQTALLGLGEIVVTVSLSYLVLNETLTTGQWLGAFLLMLTLVLVARDRPDEEKRVGRGWLHWLLPPMQPQSNVQSESIERPQA